MEMECQTQRPVHPNSQHNAEADHTPYVEFFYVDIPDIVCYDPRYEI